MTREDLLVQKLNHAVADLDDIRHLAAELAAALDDLLTPTYAYRTSEDRQFVRDQARAALAHYKAASEAH